MLLLFLLLLLLLLFLLVLLLEGLHGGLDDEAEQLVVLGPGGGALAGQRADAAPIDNALGRLLEEAQVGKIQNGVKISEGIDKINFKIPALIKL